MDIQTVCLGILSFGEATGYDIKQRLERTYRHFFAAGYGSIYPALANLAEQGLVVYRAETGPGAHSRKLYSLTCAGRGELRLRLAATAPHHRVRSEFMMLMFLADLMEPERVEALIGGRLAEIRAYLDHLVAIGADSAAGRAGPEFTRGLGLAILGATAAYLEANRETFVAALRGQERGHTCTYDAKLPGDPA